MLKIYFNNLQNHLKLFLFQFGYYLSAILVFFEDLKGKILGKALEI